MTKEQLTKQIVKLGIELERKKAELERLGVPDRVTELRGMMLRYNQEFDAISDEIKQREVRRSELNVAYIATKNELAKLEGG